MNNKNLRVRYPDNIAIRSLQESVALTPSSGGGDVFNGALPCTLAIYQSDVIPLFQSNRGIDNLFPHEAHQIVGAITGKRGIDLVLWRRGQPHQRTHFISSVSLINYCQTDVIIIAIQATLSYSGV